MSSCFMFNGNHSEGYAHSRAMLLFVTFTTCYRFHFVLVYCVKFTYLKKYEHFLVICENFNLNNTKQ